MLDRKKVLIFLAVVFSVALAYWISTYFMAYTDDAYVRSYVVDVAPRVGGAVAEVHVHNNQYVPQGTLLVTMDPSPFQYEVDRARALMIQASGSDDMTRKEVAEALSRFQKTLSALNLARVTEKRYQALVQTGAVARQRYDQTVDDLNEADQAHKEAEAALARAKEKVGVRRSDIDAAQADLNLALYRLEHSKIYSRVSGWVNNLNVRPGEYLIMGVPCMGIVDRDGWRVEANYREYLVRHMRPGQRVVVYLDSHPWRLFRGTVKGIGRGISRSPAREKINPYVEPTTNWIRLARRFPVEIVFDDMPDDLRLLHGSDARTLVVY